MLGDFWKNPNAPFFKFSECVDSLYQFLYVLFQVFLPAACEGQGRDCSCAQEEHTCSLLKWDSDGGEHLGQLSEHRNCGAAWTTP